MRRRRRGSEPVRIGFLLTVNLGNAVRYRVLRGCVDADSRVQAVWCPQRTWVDGDWLRVLPGWWRIRLRQLLDSLPLFLPRRLDAVVVHSPELWAVYGTFHAIFRPRCLLVDNTDARIEPSGALSARLQAIATRRVDLFLPWTNYVASHVPERIGYAGDPIEVVAPGVTVERWAAATAREHVRHDPLQLLFVGGDPVRKGLDVLLDALDALPGRCRLDVVTNQAYVSPELADRLEALADVATHFGVGPMSDELFALFRSADLFVMPSRYDTYGFVYAEALASGLPAIGSRVGGVSDIVVDGVTGLLCDPGDPASLVDAVQHVLSMTDREWTDLVEAGQRHAADLHDAPTNAERLTEAVRALVDGHRAVREGSGSRAHRR